MPSRATAAAVVLVGSMLAAGCGKDHCLAATPLAQIDVQLVGVAPSTVARVEVTVSVNGGKNLTRSFPTATPSFVFDLKDQSAPPRTLALSGTAFSTTGHVVAAGGKTVAFTLDACNFIMLALSTGGADGGVDGIAPGLCGKIPWKGCCVDDHTARWCAQGELQTSDCTKSPSAPTCGWRGSGGYHCGADDSSDPSGTNPRLCSAYERDAGERDGSKPDAPKLDARMPDSLKPDASNFDAPKPDASTCGNGVIEGTEECDGSAFPAGKSQCKDFNRNGGNLLCTSCKFDLTFCCLAPVPPSYIPPPKYIVSAAVGDDATGAPLCKPLRTITAALKKANATGAVIYVTAGTYSAGETFPLSVQGPISLYSATQAPIIDGAGPGALTPGNATMEASGAGVVVDGFTFKGGAVSAVRGFVTKAGPIGGISRNTFLTETGAYVLSAGAGGACAFVADNTFQTTKVGVHFECVTSLSDISGNTFSGGKVAIEITAGAPVIANNSFSGVYSTAAITCSGNASPKLRTNIFSIGVAPKRAVTITGTAIPDLGTAADPGGNSFLGGALEHAGSATISAIGNDWPGTPACGTNIVVTGAGKVLWGTSGQQCP